MTSAEEKRLESPTFAVSTHGSLRLLRAFTQQDFRDWHIVDATGAADHGSDLGTFKARLGRYLLVSIDDDALAYALEANTKMLVQVAFAIETGERGLVLLTSGKPDEEGYRACIGYVLVLRYLLDCPAIPRTNRTLFADLHDHVYSLGPKAVGELIVSDGEAAGVAVPTADFSAPRAGYRTGPFGPVDEMTKDYVRYARSVVEAPVGWPSPPRSCASNEFYGHGQVLRTYCRITGRPPIRGRVQHGWTAGGGIVTFDALARELPSFLWSERALRELDPAVERGGAVVIGAPWIYLPDLPDPGPASDRILALPLHSTRGHKVSGGWEEYARDLQEFARDEAAYEGATGVTVCLHYEDMENEQAKAAFESRGMCIVSAGVAGDDACIYRLRALIRQHRLVTSNRIGSAIMYALYERRPVAILGYPMATEPPDLYEDVTGDARWIEKNFPGIAAEGSGVQAFPEADAELGVAQKKTPEELRRLLFGWIAS